MTELTLNERDYLLRIIEKYFPWQNPEYLYDLTEVITKPQRGLLLALHFNNKKEEFISVMENIINLQFKGKESNAN